MTTTLVTNTTPPVDKVRQKILSEANEDFLEAFKEIQSSFNNEELSVIERRHKIGKLVIDMRKNEKKYGAKVVERISQLINRDRCVVYNCVKFAELYSEKELKQLINKRNKNNETLTWTHVAHLVQISDKDERQEVLEACLESSWTPSQLLKYVQSLLNTGSKSNPSSAGKPLARPKSLTGFVDNQITVLDMLIKRKEQVWAGTSGKPNEQSFFDVLTSIPNEKLSDKLFAQLTELTDKYDQAILSLTEMSTHLDTIKNKLEQRNKRTELPKEILAGYGNDSEEDEAFTEDLEGDSE